MRRSGTVRPIETCVVGTVDPDGENGSVTKRKGCVVAQKKLNALVVGDANRIFDDATVNCFFNAVQTGFTCGNCLGGFAGVPQIRRAGLRVERYRVTKASIQ